jgi:hypothetical protein
MFTLDKLFSKIFFVRETSLAQTGKTCFRSQITLLQRAKAASGRLIASHNPIIAVSARFDKG